MIGIFAVIGIIYIIYKLAEEHSWDNCKADNVDYKRMGADQFNISQAELKRRYKSGYYNKK